MMRAMSRSHSDAGDAHEMHAQLIATKRELNTAHTELSRGRVEIQRLETLVKKQQQQLDALLGDGDGPTRHELEKNLAVRRVAEKVAALKAVISDREAEVRTRDATIAELRQSQAATTIEEINRANEEYYAEVCRLRRALAAHLGEGGGARAHGMQRSGGSTVLREINVNSRRPLIPDVLPKRYEDRTANPLPINVDGLACTNAGSCR